MNITGILLAAGSGSRFGGDKLMHPLADGTPIGVASARNLRRVLRRVIAVTRPDDAALAARLQAERVDLVPCADAHLGMGASLACGMRAARDADAVIVALADMPFITAATIESIMRVLQAGAAIAAPSYQGQRGHPVGFSAQYRAELEAVSGDEGARALLKSQARRITLVEVADAGVLRDIDTRADAQP